MQVKKEDNFDFRSNCPISSALDLIGDKWSLLIIRDLMFRSKQTYKDFTLSNETIATNILADRLVKLEAHGLITKGKTPGNKKTNLYSLTTKGLDLMPLLAEYILWSDKYYNEHIALEAKQFARMLRKNKNEVLHNLQGQLRDTMGLQ